MEHSERGRYVTEQVSLWIQNDGVFFEPAKGMASEPRVLGIYLTIAIKTARRGTAPWHVAQELAANDYGRIDWAQVARDLTGE